LAIRQRGRTSLNRIVSAVACPPVCWSLSNGHGEDQIAPAPDPGAYGGAGPTSRCCFACWWEGSAFKAAEGRRASSNASYPAWRASGGFSKPEPCRVCLGGSQRRPAPAELAASYQILRRWGRRGQPVLAVGDRAASRCWPLPAVRPTAFVGTPGRATTTGAGAWPQLACRPLITAAREAKWGPMGMGPDGPASLPGCGLSGTD